MNNKQDKLAAGKWAHELLEHGQGLILDSETTEKDNPEPVELAIIDLIGNTVFNQRIKPTTLIEAGAERVHGIALEMLASEPTYLDLMPRLTEVMSGQRIIIYNAAFDVKAVNNAARRHHQSPIPFESDCAMLRFAAFRGEWNEYRGSYKWATLDGALDYFGIVMDDAQAHSALGDCRRTLEVIRAMAKWYTDSTGNYYF